MCSWGSRTLYMFEGLVCSRIAAPWPQRVDVLRRCDTSACVTASVRHARPGYAERTTGRERGVSSYLQLLGRSHGGDD